MAVQIAAEHDLVLIVGEEKRRLNVSSRQLMTASKPFAAMLGPKWLPARTGVTEISLPSDDAQAMECICIVLHHRSEIMSVELNGSAVLDIVIAAKKYDLLAAVRFAVKYWTDIAFRKCDGPNDSANELLSLAIVAYMLQDGTTFKDVTAKLILHRVGSFSTLQTEKLSFATMPALLCLLAERRSAAFMALAELLTAYPTIEAGRYNRCAWMTAYIHEWMTTLKKYSLWPMQLKALENAINTADTLPDPAPSSQLSCKCFSVHSIAQIRRQVATDLKNLRSGLGLSLDDLNSKAI